MTLVKQSTGHKMPKGAARKNHWGYRSSVELKMREQLETWCRARWPGGRIVHELTVFDGEARADMAVFNDSHFAAIEIKSPHDNTKRLIHQCAMFHLAAPEFWIVCAESHGEDAELIRFLLPKVGVIHFSGLPQMRSIESGIEPELEVLHEARTHAPHKASLLKILWRDEMIARAQAHGFGTAARSTCASLLRDLVKLTDQEALAAVCHELRRRRFAFRSESPAWAADPPVPAEANT